MANSRLRLLPLLLVVAAGAAAFAFFASVIFENLGGGPAGTRAATGRNAATRRGDSFPPEGGEIPPPGGSVPSRETAPAVSVPLRRPISTEERLARPAPPPGGGPVRGRVTRPDGAPAAGATVAFTPLSAPAGYRSLPPVTARTGPDGAFEAILPFPGVFRARAGIPAEKALAFRGAVSPGASVNLRLEPPAPVRVTVTNLAPGEEALARLERTGPADGRPGERGGPIPASREKSAFVFPEVPPGSYILAIRTETSFLERPVESRGGAPLSIAAALPPPAAGGLAGRVEDSSGTPAAGAAVRIRSAATGIFAGETETDAAGRFRLALPEGRYRLDVEAAGFTPCAVATAETGVLQEVTLVRGALWTGRVADPEGEPIRGATVVVDYLVPHIGERRRRNLTVSEAGVFTWRSAKDFSERFHVAASGFGASCFAGVVPPAGGLSAGGTGSPAPPPARTPGGEGSARKASSRPRNAATPGHSGGSLGETLPRGPSGSGPGNGPGPGGELEPFVLYGKNLLLGGVVRIAGGGENLSGAQVTLAPRSLPPESPFFREEPVRTDASGLFEFRGVAPGLYRLFVDAGGFARTAKEIDLEEDAILVLDTAPARDLAGTVTGRAGLPLAGIAVGLAAGGREFTVLTNDEGRFLLSGAPVEAVSLHVAGVVEAPIPAGVVEAPVKGGGATIRVKGGVVEAPIPAGAIEKTGPAISIRLPEGGTFSGRVLSDSGEPVRFFQAAVILPGDDEEKACPEWLAAGPEGEIRIPLPAKPKRILFRKPGFRDALVPGADLEVEGQTYRLRGGRQVVMDWTGIG